MGIKGQDWQLVAADYTRAIEKSGGCPVILPVMKNYDNINPILEKIDGILFTGGTDIAPKFYGEMPSHGLGEIVPPRDEQEIRLAKKVLLEMDIPVLGICRGIQVLNVAMGGSVYQDIISKGFKLHFTPTKCRNAAAHTVKVEPDTLLADISGAKELSVNSFHHQAVKDLALGLIPAAMSDDGLVEAFTMEGNRYVLAVQWHPEMMYDNDEQQKIFHSFVDACKNRTSEKMKNM